MTGFSNPITGGQGALNIPAIKSPNYSPGVAGWTIKRNGTAEFDSVTLRGSIVGPDWSIGNSGEFRYAAFPPGLGNLIYSDTNVGGTDLFGNAYLAGQTSYVIAPNGPPFIAMQINLGAITWYSSPSAAGPWTIVNVFDPPTPPSSAVGVEQGFFVGNGLVVNAGQLTIPASGGPFIAGEGFHNITLGAGLAGSMRVKKLPWNAIWFDTQLTVTASGTINCGNLPDATYYPTGAKNLPLAPTVAGSTAYIHLPTSGAVQVITSAASGNPGGSFMYPTN